MLQRKSRMNDLCHTTEEVGPSPKQVVDMWVSDARVKSRFHWIHVKVLAQCRGLSSTAEGQFTNLFA